MNTDNLTDDQYASSADGYEGFMSLYYDYDATDLHTDSHGLYAVKDGKPVGFIPGGTEDEYMLWVYINIK